MPHRNRQDHRAPASPRETLSLHKVKPLDLPVLGSRRLHLGAALRHRRSVQSTREVDPRRGLGTGDRGSANCAREQMESLGPGDGSTRVCSNTPLPQSPREPEPALETPRLERGPQAGGSWCPGQDGASSPQAAESPQSEQQGGAAAPPVRAEGWGRGLGTQRWQTSFLPPGEPPVDQKQKRLMDDDKKNEQDSCPTSQLLDTSALLQTGVPATCWRRGGSSHRSTCTYSHRHRCTEGLPTRLREHNWDSGEGKDQPSVASWAALGLVRPCAGSGSQLGSSRPPPLSHHYPPPGQPPEATPWKPGVLPKARFTSPPHVTIPEGFPGETLHSSTFYHFTSLKGEKHDNKIALSLNTVIFSKAGTGTGFHKTLESNYLKVAQARFPSRHIHSGAPKSQTL